MLADKGEFERQEERARKTVNNREEKKVEGREGFPGAEQGEHYSQGNKQGGHANFVRLKVFGRKNNDVKTFLAKRILEVGSATIGHQKGENWKEKGAFLQCQQGVGTATGGQKTTKTRQGHGGDRGNSWSETVKQARYW